MKKVKSMLVITMVSLMGLMSCEKENPQPNSNGGNGSNGGSNEDCKCGIVISVEYDAVITDGYLQGRYYTKVRNECSNNIKEFTLIPHNGDKIPEEGGYWCDNNDW